MSLLIVMIGGEKDKMVAKGPFMEQLEGIVTTAGTVEVTEIATPVSRTEKMAMLIHYIQINFGEMPEFTTGVQSAIAAAIASRSFEGDGFDDFKLDQPEIIFRRQQYTSEGIIPGAFGTITDGDNIVYFNPPMLYAKQSIYLNAIDVNTSAAEVTCKIGYTIDKVSEADFIASLVE